MYLSYRTSGHAVWLEHSNDMALVAWTPLRAGRLLLRTYVRTVCTVATTNPNYPCHGEGGGGGVNGDSSTVP